MYHLSTYTQDQSTRTDFCSGFFKHLDPKAVTEVGAIFVNSTNQILVIRANQENMQKWQMPTISKLENESPKQSCTRLAKQNELTINPKNLKQFYYYKHCQLQEKDYEEEALKYRHETSAVYFLIKIEEDHKESDTKIAQINQGQWINPNELTKFIQNEEIHTVIDLLNSKLE